MTLKEFVVFRHAQKSSWIADPDLSEEGHQQAQLLVDLVRLKMLPTPDLLLCSPKKRSQQTFLPLHQELQIPIEIDPILDERGNAEKGLHFENRIKNYLDLTLPQKPHNCVFICTHLDWMEIFGLMAPIDVDITSEVIHMPPAFYYHFSLVAAPQGLWKLIRKSKVG